MKSAIDAPSPTQALRDMRANVNWDKETERRDLLRRLFRFMLSARAGRDGFPNLAAVFSKREMDRLLAEAVLGGEPAQAQRFVNMVIASGYEDEPDVDGLGQPVLRCTTAIHLAAASRWDNRDALIRRLFRIYSRYEANYTDECGLTHFHVACLAPSTCRQVARRFLELGLDRSCAIIPRTGESLLHRALDRGHWKLLGLLLESGAWPWLTSRETGLNALERVVVHQRRGGGGDYDEGYLRAIFDRHLGHRDGFFRGWACLCFMELTRWRLPPRACRTIVNELRIEDLWSLCVAATRLTDRQIFARLCGTVDDWSVSQDRYDFLRRLDPLIENWKGRLPDLRATLGKTIVDQLLIDSVYCHCEGCGDGPTRELTRFVEFVHATGYRDQPRLDEEGEPVTRLATAVHHAYRRGYDASLVDELFKIYDKFEVDYSHEYVTHYHVARESKCTRVAKMFHDAKLARLHRDRLRSSTHIADDH